MLEIVFSPLAERVPLWEAFWVMDCGKSKKEQAAGVGQWETM